MLSSANSFSDRFHYIDQRLRDLNGRANQQLEVTVQEINSLAVNIAKMNEEIARAHPYDDDGLHLSMHPEPVR